MGDLFPQRCATHDQIYQEIFGYSLIDMHPFRRYFDLKSSLIGQVVLNVYFGQKKIVLKTNGYFASLIILIQKFGSKLAIGEISRKFESDIDRYLSKLVDVGIIKIDEESHAFFNSKFFDELEENHFELYDGKIE